jgi:hypothetical protein
MGGTWFAVVLLLKWGAKKSRLSPGPAYGKLAIGNILKSLPERRLCTIIPLPLNLILDS